MSENLPPRVKYWLTEANHDCFFVVGPDNGKTERIGAIKVLLMGDSEPFRSMLQYSELAEKGDVRVTDVEPDTFWTFLKCVYGAGSLIIPKLTFEECAKLLYVAEKYLVNEVKTEISKYLNDVFSPDKIFVVFSHPVCYQEESLKVKVSKYVKLNFKKLTEDDEFLNLDHTAIMWILQRKCIFVKEVEIWNAVLRWAKHKTGSRDGKVLRSLIFDLLKNIHFLTMDQKEFWDFVVSSEILLDDEVNCVCRSFVSGELYGTEHLSKNTNNRYNIYPVDENIVSTFTGNPTCAFIHCSVSSISDLMECHTTIYQCSKTYFWAGHFWMLSVSNNDKRSEPGSSLVVLVDCRGQKSNWNCVVDVEISLINQAGKPDERMVDNAVEFTQTTDSFGWNSYFDWERPIKLDNGFIKDNSVIILLKLNLLPE